MTRSQIGRLSVLFTLSAVCGFYIALFPRMEAPRSRSTLEQTTLAAVSAPQDCVLDITVPLSNPSMTPMLLSNFYGSCGCLSSERGELLLEANSTNSIEVRIDVRKRKVPGIVALFADIGQDGGMLRSERIAQLHLTPSEALGAELLQLRSERSSFMPGEIVTLMIKVPEDHFPNSLTLEDLTLMLGANALGELIHIERADDLSTGQVSQSSVYFVSILMHSLAVKYWTSFQLDIRCNARDLSARLEGTIQFRGGLLIEVEDIEPSGSGGVLAISWRHDPALTPGEELVDPFAGLLPDSMPGNSRYLRSWSVQQLLEAGWPTDLEVEYNGQPLSVRIPTFAFLLQSR